MNATKQIVKESPMASWRKRNRFHMQVATLAVLLISPFGLYGAVMGGNYGLASAFFAFIAAGMAVMAWLG